MAGTAHAGIGPLVLGFHAYSMAGTSQLFEQV